MIDIPRQLDLVPLLERRSYFLFGPRQTGKTHLIRAALSSHRCYDLLRTDVFARLSHSPNLLREEITDEDGIVIIDEIQKLPVLLDEVHLLIEERGVRFLLTGSSARKLRRGGVNLLGGRARTKRLHPFIARELGEQFDLNRALDVGLVPPIYLSDEPWADLAAYVGAYLQEEVAAEALVRSIPAFSRFLTVAGVCHAKIINYTKIGNDAQVPKTTVQEYFHILKDTLIATELPAWRQTVKRKALATSKLYFFDTGVARWLQRRCGLQPGAPEYGEAFEAYLHHELQTYCDYESGADLHYWRSTSGFEVDFVLGERTAIEVKAKANVTERDLKGLRALKEEALLDNYIVVCLEDRPRRKPDGIQILPRHDFLERLWEGDYD